MSVPDQRDLWRAHYRANDPAARRPSVFAGTCLPLMAAGSRILELGCGQGADAATFAAAGHTVVATDFVPELIAHNRDRLSHLPTLTFREMRIDSPYPFPDGAFDAVYAHLTLHYYLDVTTRGIVREIRRVLRPGGMLMFACKSPGDPAWGRGVEIEPDMFDLNGKVRHFFSEDYARRLLEDGFDDVQVESHQGRLYRQRAGWITVVAHRLA